MRIIPHFFLLLCLCANNISFAQSGIISTFAGNGYFSYSGPYGDGGPATAAEFYELWAVAADNHGNVYIIDNGNERIRKVNAAGYISTFAGNGRAGYGGDGGYAVAAQLYNSWGVAVDGSGNVYIADAAYGRIRKVNSSGIISTFAGVGTSPGSYGYSGDGGPATAAALNEPQGMAIDRSGNVYIADYANSRIRKVDPSGYISTFAGNGTSGFSGDGGAATNAELYYPTSVALDGSGNVYIADYANHRIRKVNAAGTITTIAGNGVASTTGNGGPATAAEVTYPYGIVIDRSGNILISTGNNIRKINPSGIITNFAGDSTGTGVSGYSGDGGPATAAKLSTTLGISLDGNDNLYITDYNNNRIRKISNCPYPTVAPITGSGSICTGSSSTLYDATTGGIWSVNDTTIATINSSGRVTAVRNGTTTVSYTVTNSCGSQSSTKPVNVISIPWVAPITGASNVGVGGAITVYDAAGGGVWGSSDTTICKTSVAGSVWGISAGTAVISYTVTNACGTTSATKTMKSRRVVFTNGKTETISMCKNSGAYSLNIYLPVYEQNAGRTLQWSMLSSPNHGTATVSYSGTSVAGTNTPYTTAFTPSGTFAGTDSFRIAVSDGAAADTQMVYIVITDLPPTPAISGASSVCVGSSITLTGSPAGGYWSSNRDADISYTSVGVVTGLSGSSAPVMYYSVTNSGGCFATAAHRVAVNVPGLIGGIDGSVTSVSVGGSIIVSHPIAGGTWGISNPAKATISAIGPDSASVTGVASGRDTILYTLTNSCGTLTAMWPISITAHRSDIGSNPIVAGEDTINIKLYPNPTTGIITLEVEGTIGVTSIAVSDITGKTLTTSETEEQKLTLDMSQLPAGMYFVKVNTGGKTFVEKMVIR